MKIGKYTIKTKVVAGHKRFEIVDTSAKKGPPGTILSRNIGISQAERMLEEIMAEGRETRPGEMREYERRGIIR